MKSNVDKKLSFGSEMVQINGPLDILKLLDKSNCGKCGRKTCLAFAGGVFKGDVKIEDCPKLDRETVEQLQSMESTHISAEDLSQKAIENMKSKICSVDLMAAAKRLGGEYLNGRLTVKILGKDVSVDSQGNIFTEIHVNRWMAGPLYSYILNGAGKDPSGKWVTFRELDGGEYLYPLFEQRCEKPLKRVADTYTGLFEDMLHVFSGKQVDYHYYADISILLHPLPKVPIMICYSSPQGEIESNLSIFFDVTIRENLGFEGAFSLGTGLTLMFEKIALNHGKK